MRQLALHECAPALLAPEIPFPHKIGEGEPDRCLAYGKHSAERVFGRDKSIGNPFSVLDLPPDYTVDLHIELLLAFSIQHPSCYHDILSFGLYNVYEAQTLTSSENYFIPILISLELNEAKMIPIENILFLKRKYFYIFIML
jgi:hypothetical protein